MKTKLKKINVLLEGKVRRVTLLEEHTESLWPENGGGSDDHQDRRTCTRHNP